MQGIRKRQEIFLVLKYQKIITKQRSTPNTIVYGVDNGSWDTYKLISLLEKARLQ